MVVARSDVEELGQGVTGDDHATAELEAGDLAGPDELVGERSGDPEEPGGGLDAVRRPAVAGRIDGSAVRSTEVMTV